MPFVAIGAVDLFALIVALVAFIMLGGFYLVLRFLQNLFKRVPLVGGPIASVFGTFATAEMKLQAFTLDNLVHPLAHLFEALGGAVWWIIHQITGTTAHVNSKATVANNNALQAQAGVNAAEGALRAEIAQAQAAATADAEAFASIHDSALKTSLEGEFAAQQAALEQQIAGLQSQLATLGTAEQTGLASVTATLQGEITSVESDVHSIASELFGTVEPEIAALQQEVAGLSIPNLTNIEDVINSDIARALAAAGVAAIPGLLSQVGAITTEVTQCLEPLCDTVTPNAKQLGGLGNFLKNLEALGFEAALVALAVLCITDPAEVSQDISSTVHAVGDGIVTGVKDLIGV